MIREIAQHLENETSVEIGSTLFVGWRPLSAPVACTVLLERVPPRENAMLAGRVEYPVQFLTRAADYYGGRDQAYELYNKVHGAHRAGFDLPILTSGEAYRVAVVDGLAPGYIGQDEKGNHEFSTNLVFRIEPK